MTNKKAYRIDTQKTHSKNLGKIFLITGAIVAMTFAGINNASAQRGEVASIPITATATTNTACINACKNSFSAAISQVDSLSKKRSNNLKDCRGVDFSDLNPPAEYHYKSCYIADSIVGSTRTPVVGTIFYNASCSAKDDKGNTLKTVNPFDFYGKSSEKIDMNKLNNCDGNTRTIKWQNIMEHAKNLCIEKSAEICKEMCPLIYTATLKLTSKQILEIIHQGDEGVAGFRTAVGNAINGMDFTKFYDPILNRHSSA